MTRELGENEVEEVTEALKSQQRQLLNELAHADSRAFRAMLREKAERVERLMFRIEHAIQESRLEPRIDSDGPSAIS